jgi:hypothetical protein
MDSTLGPALSSVGEGFGMATASIVSALEMNEAKEMIDVKCLIIKTNLGKGSHNIVYRKSETKAQTPVCIHRIFHACT